ncbi:MAG: VTT domain-containing protein [Acidimicrobiales bacterium]
MSGEHSPFEIEVDAEAEAVMPGWLQRLFAWTWTSVTGTKIGFAVFVLLIYVLPYGLGLVAIGSQISSGGDFVLLAFAALVASTFASGQPAPTPTMGTLSMILTGFLGAYFDPLVVTAMATAAGTVGLVVSYGAGAAGIGRLIFERMQNRPAVVSAVERAFKVTRDHGPWAILVLTFVPNPAYAWSSVAMGASKAPFGRYLLAAVVGSAARFAILAFLGAGIENAVN